MSATDPEIMEAAASGGIVDWATITPVDAELARAPSYLMATADGTVVLQSHKGTDIPMTMKAGVQYRISPKRIKPGGTLATVQAYYTIPIG